MTSPKAASRRAAAGCDVPQRAAAEGLAGSPLSAGPPLRSAPPPVRSAPGAWERRAAPAESAALARRRSEARRAYEMRERSAVGALSVVLILALGLPPGALACPHPCACYVPTEVHCTFRSLAAVPARISKHVERINFGFNSIQSIYENSFAGLTKLELLMIHGNDIQNIPNGALKDLVSLQVFKISYNKLKVITGQTLHGLSSLMRLHVDHNRIEFIHPNAFNGLTSLRLVHLEGNLLQQLHPHTFSTFTVLNYFKLSTVRHLYLSENAISMLPAGMFQGMPLLENLYLHGNPWACDCSLQWLLDWNENSGGVLKCKKDKAYEGGQLCPRCHSPKQLQKEDIQNLKDISCRKPIIQSSLRHNSSTQDEEDGESYELPLEVFQSSPWNITLNMTDEHGNVVHLNCEIKKPTGSTKIQWNQIQTQEIDINATISLDFECPMNRENYEKLWKLIAYYSEVPVKLERELMLSKEPKISYRYKQGSDYDALYYTGVKAQILAEPSWVMQPLINIQLNRRQSTGKKVVLSFFTVFSQAIHTKDTRQQRSWIMIEQNQSTRKAQSVVEGSECQLNCNVKASERPFIQWLFPDGTKLQAPFNQKDSRFSILTSGQLVIKPVSYTDAGLYHCIAQVRDDIDVMAYRLLVQPPAIQVADSDIVRVEKNVGDPIVLPCSAIASPEAQLSWILPSSQVLNVLSNFSKGYVLDNGTLLIPKSHISDSGHYRCVAVNQLGSDQFIVRVTVNKMVSDRSFKRIKLKKRTRSKSSSKTRGRVIDDGEGSGTGGADEFPRRKNHLKDREIPFKQKSDQMLEAQIKKGKKGRRKMKIWKGTDRTQDSNVAEGRRAFESRRRINMASKQINPQHWADILAKVRGKNLPRTTVATAILLATTLPPDVQKTTPVPHTVAIPLHSETTADVVDSSADASTLSENEPFSVTVSHSSKAFSAWSTITGRETEHFYDQRALKTPASVHSVEIPVSGPILATVQPQGQQHQNGRADSSVVVKENIHAVTEEPLTEETMTNYLNIQSSSFRVEHVDATVSSKSEENSAFAELPLDASVLAESQTVDLHSVLETEERLNEMDQMSVDNIILAPSQLGDIIPTDSVGATAISSSVTVKSSDFIHEHRGVSTAQTKIADLSTTSHAVISIKVQSKEESETHRSTVTQESMSSTYIESFQEREQRNLSASKTDPTFISPSTNVPHKKTEVITAISTSKLTTAATTSTPYRKTAPSLVTQHARKRPYGRRRLRPNRIRQRTKPVPRVVLTTEAMPNIPRTSKVEAVTKAFSAVLESPDLKSNVRIQAKEEDHREITPSLVTNPVVLEKMTKTEEVVTTSFFSPTTSQPEKKYMTHSASPETFVLPVTEPITVLSSYVAHNTVPTKESSAPLTPEQNKMQTFDSLENVSEERSLKADSKAPDSEAEPTSPATTEYWSSLTSSTKSSYPESQKETITFESDVVANETTVGTFQPMYPTVTDLSIPSDTLEVLEDVSDSEGLWKPTVFLKTPAVTEPPQQQEIMSSSSSFSTMETQSFPPPETEISIVSHTGAKTSSLDKKETISNVFHHDPILQTSEKPQTTHVFIPFTKPPTLSSTLHHSIHYTTKGDNAFNQERLPAVKQVEAESERMVVSSRQNVPPTPFSSQNRISIQSKEEQFKEMYSSRSNNSLLLNPNLPRPPPGMIPSLNQRLPIVPPKHVPVRGTVKPPYVVTQGSFRYFITHQPLHYTNKPEITAYAAHTIQDKKSFASQRETTTPTQATPFHRTNTFPTSKFSHQGQNRYNINSRFFGSNYVPDNRGTAGRLPSQEIPYYPSSRVPFLFNRTRILPHLGIHPKPVVPGQPVPKDMNEKKVAQVSPPRITVQKATAVPVPSHTTTTISPPAVILKVTPPAFFSQSRRPQISTTVQPFQPLKNAQYHQKVPSVPYVGGITSHNLSIIQSSSNFRTPGERPKIITKGSQSISILAETDALIPCDAVGEPKPFITWTKVSTGALMTAHTRLQRFEVLKNGTFLIRNAQLQDRGQYLCTAQNLHGIDKMIFALTVVAHQPKILLSRYQDVTVYFGDTIALECQASGTPSPHISWIFPDRKILQTVTTTESRIMLHENRTLSIKQATFSDRGVYKCVASNAAGADSIAVRLHIAALPPIIQQDKQENISLPLGSSINIHCTAKAAPSPSIRWVLFDGTQIRPSQFVNGNLFVFPNGTLYIRNVSPKDSGIYECIAANMVGAARRIIQLHVKKQASNAKITGSSPQRTDVTYGSILHLDCSASGDPWPRILWRLPSKRMIDSLHSNLETRIKVFSNGTLVVHSVTDKDAGDYLCVARNKIGDDYVVLKVNVMMKPAKIEHKNENNHKVKYGGDLKVDCVATGLPNPEISWGLPDGSMINTFMQSDDSGSRTKRYVVFNNGTLYFNDVGLREEGDYTCYAENQIGKDEMKVRVKVVAEPATIRNKTYVIINVPYGDVVTVACEAKGEPTPKVTWLSPTNRPIPTLSEKYQVYRDGTLLIQKAQRSDSGNYTCVVRNSAGEDRKVVWIHVNVQPPRINGHLNAITSVRETASRDSRKLIDCKAEGIPSPRVLWAFPEGVILPAPYYGNRITVHRNGTLDIRGVRQTDAVQLVCIGRNEGGEARLIVQLVITDHLEKPSFRDPVNERITAIAGHSINLNCSVQGYPEPTTSWILPNGTEVLSGNRLHRFYHKRDGILHISGLSTGDAGTYRCTARNPGGYVERVVFLKVGLRPEISNQYNNLVSIINGETLQLHCITQPNQRAQISWTLPNGMVLDAPQAVGRFSLLENGSLTVREASVFDRGTYLCKVSSDYGTSIMNVPVIVIAYPPRITSEPAPVIYARPGNSVKLNCMAIGIPKAEITWELPDKSHLTTGAQSRLYGNKFLHPQGSLVIQQSSQRDAGFYKCTAKNILGSDSKTTYIHIF